MKKPGTCKHYTGTRNERCDAGVSYIELAGPEYGLAVRLPCIDLGRRRTPPVEPVPCDRYEEPTAAEVAAWNAQVDAAIARVEAVVPLVERMRREGTSAAKFPCPACGAGILAVALAPSNGHARARCSTPDCVDFME